MAGQGVVVFGPNNLQLFLKEWNPELALVVNDAMNDIEGLEGLVQGPCGMCFEDSFSEFRSLLADQDFISKTMVVTIN